MIVSRATGVVISRGWENRAGKKLDSVSVNGGSRIRLQEGAAPLAASNAKRAELPAFFRNDHPNGPRPVAVAAAPIA
jgi:hypothetical protein